MDRDQQWSFSGALLYSVTVITTIGYGNLAPKTAAGKIVTMIYALFGVPLLLLCLSNLGSLLADTFLFAYSHSCCYGHKHRQTECKDRYTEAIPSPPAGPAMGAGNVPVRNTMVRMGSGGRPVCQLTPEARHVLAECAEYQLAHTCSDPSATSILRQLNAANVAAPPDEFDDDSICMAINDTPSRVPLIWRDGKRSLTPGSPLPPITRPAGPPADPPRVPVSLVLVVLVGYICLGAAIFAAWEEWTYLDGAYFCFVTLSTIGFGDLVPGKSFQRPDTQDGQIQLVACCIYLLIGLVLIAMSFSLVQETVAAKSRQFAMCIGLLSQDQDS
nr:PREDICTED: potassium channel subfamily K member 18-like [Bemisia tabaci]XP_018917182.1 PREDICTED: potassium channel subfamily K member 18-like [Bemisia tabaci]